MTRVGGDPAVVCEGLVVEYGEVRAVDEVSFTVAPGEVFGLLGPNGAGKTSVIRALTTILEPKAGHARIAGASLNEPTAIRHVIGVLPESNGYPNSQSATDYLRFYGRLFGLNGHEAAERADSLLAQMGLHRHRHQRIGTFSRGMRQRLGIARALVNRPQVLFMDEPTLGLDPAGKDEVLRYLAYTAAEEGTAVVLCSHLLDEVERTCDTVAILHKGRLALISTVEGVAEAAGIRARARLTTAPELVEDAVAALELADVVSMASANGRRGEVAVDLASTASSVNEVAAVLIGKNLPIMSLELEGARLSDAFMALTGAAVEDGS